MGEDSNLRHQRVVVVDDQYLALVLEESPTMVFGLQLEDGALEGCGYVKSDRRIVRTRYRGRVGLLRAAMTRNEGFYTTDIACFTLGSDEDALAIALTAAKRVSYHWGVGVRAVCGMRDPAWIDRLLDKGDDIPLHVRVACLPYVQNPDHLQALILRANTQYWPRQGNALRNAQLATIMAYVFAESRGIAVDDERIDVVRSEKELADAGDTEIVPWLRPLWSGFRKKR